MNKVILFVICNLLVFNMFGQESFGGSPTALSLDLVKEVPTIVTPELNVATLLLEDNENEKNGEILRAAVIQPLDLNPYNSGVWTNLENGDRVWRIAIKASGAHATNLLFKDFALADGAKLFLYQSDLSQVLGSFTSENNHESQLFATDIIYNETVVVEYYEPSSKANSNSFTIEGVSNFYKKTPSQINEYDFGDSDNCQVNMNCSEGNSWQNEGQGVARILIKDGNQYGWCTGSLVNNTNQDCKPYFLTAYHCGGDVSNSDFNQWIFHFNYESSGCNNGNETSILNSADYFSITGCSFRTGSNNGGSSSSDFLLVEFNSPLSSANISRVYFNGWDRTSKNTETSNGVSIHHPGGDIKKISTFSQTLTTVAWNNNGLPSHYRVFWDGTTNGHGVTEGGSSGSPIFNDQGQIIGTLTGGGSSCNNTSASDRYGKVSYHWNSNGSANNRRLDVWLDPAGNGSATSMQGSTNPCQPTSSLDAGISAIVNPDTEICGASFTPEVTLRNYGTGNLTSCQINYQTNGGAVQTFNWSGNLSSNGTINVVLNSITANAGANTFTAYTDNPNGGIDGNASNNSQSTSFNAIAGISLPLTQGFQNNTFPPTNYSISNGDSDITWDRITGVGANSSASMYMDNWDYNAPGSYDWLVLPALDFTNITAATLSFDYAYAYYDGNQGVNYDSLAIAYSTNCGDTWLALFFEGGPSLETAGGQGTEFVPTGGDWENEVIDLNIPEINNEPGVLFAIVGINGYGNNLYVDNINIESAAPAVTPVADFTVSNALTCAGTSLTFSDNSSNSPNNYSWSFPGGTPSSSSLENPVVSYTNPGTYSVTLTASNSAGSDSETKTNFIVVNENPTATTSTTEVNCNDGTISVLAMNGVAPYTYSWDGLAASTSFVDNLTEGTYNVTVTDANQCSVSVEALVENGPNAIDLSLVVMDNTGTGGVSSISGTVVGGTPAYTYLWSNGSTESMISGISTGLYTLTVTDAVGCSDSETAAIGNVAINSNPTWIENLSLYPNPTNGLLNIELSLARKQNIRFEVYNALGQIFYTRTLNNFQSGKEIINVSDEAKGLYFVRITSRGKSSIYRFVKK